MVSSRVSNKIPDLASLPYPLVKKLMADIMYAIPPGTGVALAEGRWDDMRTPLTHLVEGVLRAQKELFDAEKEARRDRFYHETANLGAGS